MSDIIKIQRTNSSRLALKILSVTIVLFFIIDAFYKIQVRGGYGNFRIGVVVKGLFEIMVLFYAIVTIDRQKLNVLSIILFFIVSFLLGQYFLSINEPGLNLFENINRLFKYLYFIIVYLLAIDIIKSSSYPERLFVNYKRLVIFNAAMIIVGFLFSIDVLKTYDGPWRFGYDGLIYAQNEATYFIIFALTTFYYRRYYLHKKDNWVFWLILFTSLLVATKAVFLYMALLFLYHVIQRVSIKRLIIISTGTLIIGYLIFSSKINEIFINAWQTFQYNSHRHGYIFALLSGRNVFFEKKLAPLLTQKWTILNYIIGGQDAIKHYIEMGFIDLFLFFGILGFLLYLYVFLRIFNLLNFEYKFKVFFFSTLTLIIALSGHFFTSSIVAMYFIVFILINHKYN